MASDLTRFFIALPGCRSRHPNPRDKERSPNTVRQPMPSYLRDLPQMPDFLMHIAGYHELTRAEQACLSLQIRLLKHVVRTARERWRDETGGTEEDLGVGGVL